MRYYAGALALGLVAVFAVAPARAASTKTSYSLTLKKSSDTAKASALFYCQHDRVYANVDLSRGVKGNNVLEGFWYRPDGKLQEHTKLPLELGSKAGKRFFMWLKFHVEKKGLEDMIVPDFKDEAFDGDWKVEVFWNNQKVAASTFTVRCV